MEIPKKQRQWERTEKEEREKTIFLSGSIFTACVASLLFSQVIFYGGGHWVKFNGLRFTAGMTGMDSFNWYLCGILLGLDTFCGEIISVLMFPIFLSYFSLSSSLSSASAAAQSMTSSSALPLSLDAEKVVLADPVHSKQKAKRKKKNKSRNAKRRKVDVDMFDL